METKTYTHTGFQGMELPLFWNRISEGVCVWLRNLSVRSSVPSPPNQTPLSGKEWGEGVQRGFTEFRSSSHLLDPQLPSLRLQESVKFNCTSKQREKEEWEIWLSRKLVSKGCVGWMSRHMRAYRLPGIPKTCFSLICLKLLPGRPHAVFNKK